MIRILIVDDHAIVRAGLKQLLEDKSDIEVIYEAGSGAEALNLIRQNGLDMVLLDISMPGKGGLEVLKQIKMEQPDLPVLILSMHSEDQYALRALKLGAAGYLVKHNAPEELFAAVRKAAAGGRYISEVVADKLASSVDSTRGAVSHETLTNREFQVFNMLVSGKPVSEIAHELSLSVKTISTHRSHILVKMNVKNNAELMFYAISNGLVNYLSNSVADNDTK